MSRPSNRGLPSIGSTTKALASEGLRTIEEAQSYANDVIALSTLPAMWLGAPPQRIGESLLAVLQTTLRPALSYILIPAFPGASTSSVELCYVDGEPARAEHVEILGRTISVWAAEHDPDDVLDLPASPAGGRVRICAYPLGHDARSGILAAGFDPDAYGDLAPTPLQRTLLNIAANQAITACRNVALQSQAQAAQAETEALYDVARILSAELDLQAILQKTTDAATRLTNAKFGAFFHNTTDDRGESYVLYTLSGAPREAFDKFGMPRNTELFEHTFRGRGPVRLDDVQADSRYGKMPPHHGMPKGHLPVRSYLAVPVTTRTGDVLGGLFLGHPDPGIFTAAAERIAIGITQHAAVALELAQLFAKSDREIAQRKQVEETLREQDRRKDDFLSTLAHELRNPLAPIRMAVSILRSFADDVARRQKATDILDRQTSHLVHLIDDLLDVSRISRGKVSLRKQRIAIASAIQQAVDGARALTQGRDLELSVTIPEQSIQVEVDPVRVAQIVGNLLNNACKYTGEGGHIWVDVEPADHHVLIRVRDDGIGIPPDHLASIFDMFVQVEESTTRSPGGLGIGLSLARSLAEMHGGTLVAHSEGLGKGSEFVLRLPLVTTVATETAPPVKQASESAHEHRLRIVAVDDYSDALESVTLLLQLHGHEVLTAANGQQALELIETHRPDAVLLDIGLPDMDGYQVARQIRRWPWATDLMLIAMTGWGQDQDKQRAMDAGFDEHLTKPAHAEHLQRLLRRVGRTRRT